jgi:hypothetical protein
MEKRTAQQTRSESNTQDTRLERPSKLAQPRERDADDTRVLEVRLLRLKRDRRQYWPAVSRSA